MKKLISLVLATCLVLSLSGCDKNKDAGQSSRASSFNRASSLPTVSNSSIPTVSNPVKHSEYYLEGYKASDIAEYFAEVALDVEYSDGVEGDANSLIRKWKNSIVYKAVGNPTKEDEKFLKSFVLELNKIDGMPEIYEASTEEANFIINFCSAEEINSVCPDEAGFVNGYTTIWWYDATLEVHDAMVYIRNDIDRESRSKIIMHEFYQSLGLLRDTTRKDSVIYESDLTADKMSELDLLILKLLYSDEIKLCMDKAECTKIINKLYY